MCYLLTCLYKMYVVVSFISDCVCFFVYMHYSCRVYQNINMYYIYIIFYIMFHIVLLYC